MRGKSVKKILTLFMALFVAVAVSIPVLADGFKYDPINGTTTQFDKYLVVKDGETNPAVTFEFKEHLRLSRVRIRTKSISVKLNLV